MSATHRGASGLSPETVERLVAAMLEFDPSDDYHVADLHGPGYYAAIYRCIRLVKGDIKDWTSPPPSDDNRGEAGGSVGDRGAVVAVDHPRLRPLLRRHDRCVHLEGAVMTAGREATWEPCPAVEGDGICGTPRPCPVHMPHQYLAATEHEYAGRETARSTTEDAVSNRRTFVTVEVEMGFDHEPWDQVGLEAPPEDADALVAQLKDESHDSIRELIRDWSLDDFVNLTVVVTHNDSGQVTRTVARWSQP